MRTCPASPAPTDPAEASGARAAIRIEGLTVSYDDHPALRDVSLDVPAGGVTAIVGPSGSGKSTLLAAMNRMTDLVAGASVTGRILLDGHDVLDRRTDVVALRRRVGMIFQRPNPLPMSIRRNITLPLREHGERRRERLDAAVEEALRAVGLWDEVSGRLDRPAEGLSGGQQQRLCIARALALAPSVLLLDEPCSALDPVATERIEALVAELRGRYTVVVVTHNLGQARRVADRTAVLWPRDGAGRLVEWGATADVLERPEDADAAAYVAGRSG